MKLTGKALKEFGIWHFERNTPIQEYRNFHLLSETCQNAVIIEFFDSVGIYIELLYFVDGNYFVSIVYHNDGYNHIGDFDSRTEATNEAIIKANDLYNKKLKKC